MKQFFRSALIFSVAFLVVFTLSPSLSLSQTPDKKIAAPPQTRILFLFDASKSMMTKWQSDTKYNISKKLLSNIVDSLQGKPNIELALRVYGHMKNFPPQDCDDTKLEVPFGYNNGYKIKRRLNEISPSGTTPIARTLEACASDFPETKGRNIVILITDGIEECDGDPCAVSKALQQKGIIVKPFVIGLGVNKDFIKQFECVGQYYDAQNEEQFHTALNVVISQALNSTTIQVNLLDIAHNPTETNVAMTFYDMMSGQVRYNFIHTMNSKGLPDTLRIDALGQYRIVVHTIPPVSEDSIKLTPGKHTQVGIDAPQGDLFLKFDGASDYKNLKCIVRKNNDQKTLNVQDFNTKEKYIVGKYDLEVLCLPRMYVNDVSIDQSKTTTVQIPNPGIISIFSNGPGYGSILMEDKNELKWVIDLDENSTKQVFFLQPGNYKAVFRPKSSNEAEFTIEKPFKVASGSSGTVELN